MIGALDLSLLTPSPFALRRRSLVDEFGLTMYNDSFFDQLSASFLHKRSGRYINGLTIRGGLLARTTYNFSTLAPVDLVHFSHSSSSIFFDAAVFPPHFASYSTQAPTALDLILFLSPTYNANPTPLRIYPYRYSFDDLLQSSLSLFTYSYKTT